MTREPLPPTGAACVFLANGRIAPRLSVQRLRHTRGGAFPPRVPVRISIQQETSPIVSPFCFEGWTLLLCGRHRSAANIAGTQRDERRKPKVAIHTIAAAFAVPNRSPDKRDISVAGSLVELGLHSRRRQRAFLRLKPARSGRAGTSTEWRIHHWKLQTGFRDCRGWNGSTWLRVPAFLLPEQTSCEE